MLISKAKLKKMLKERSNQLSSLEKIDSFLKNLYNRKLPYIPKNRLKPSDLGKGSLRKAYYSYFHVPPDKRIDPDVAKIFATGDFMEEMVMEWIRGIGEHIPYVNKDGSIPKSRATGKPDSQFSIKLEEWFITKGKIDNVAILADQIWLYEFKSMKAEKWDKLKAPEYPHLIQTATYIVGFDRGLEDGSYSHIKELRGYTHVAGVKFFYINKNTSQIKEFIMEAKNFLPYMQDIEDKVEKLKPFLQSKTLPPCENCDYFCEYWKKCKEDFNEVFTYEELKGADKSS